MARRCEVDVWWSRFWMSVPVLLCVGCAPEPSPEVEVPDYLTRGAATVSISTQAIAIDEDCEMDVSIYTPDAEAAGPLVVLAHGFVRAKSNMWGWADHLASWGVEVVTPDLCHSSFTDSDHAANAEEMIALAATLGGGEVIYAGQSAGGLSALVAAADDPNAIAAIGLDATDSSGLGVQRIVGASVPIYGLVGEPSTCNAESNGVAIYEAASDATAVRITEADHCDFEDVTDTLCTAVCPGTNDQFSDDAIHDAILGMLTAAVLEGASGGEGLTRWWFPGGEDYDALTSSGAIQPL